MSILESFAESGALLTMATTHHGELKTLKYRYIVVVARVNCMLLSICISSLRRKYKHQFYGYCSSNLYTRKMCC